MTNIKHQLKINLLFAIIGLSVILTSCGKSGVTPSKNDTTKIITGTIIGGPGIYIGGYESTTNDLGQFLQVAKVWKNGKATALTDGTNDAEVSSVFVTDKDVYAAGYENNGDVDIAKIWINGKATALSTQRSQAKAVYVIGADVYVAGTENYRAIVWKNGIGSPITANGGAGFAYSIYVVGQNYYAAGTDNYVAKLWTNGSSVLLPQEGTAANFVTVVNGDVYVAGQVNNTGQYAGYGGTAVIWKNGLVTKLTVNTSDAAANAVYINGKDIYAVGLEEGANGDANYVAKVWKNGAATKLSSYESSGNAVLLSGSDLYILGDDSKGKNPSVKSIVTLWKNGVATTYTDGTHDAHGASLFIKQ